MFEFLKAHWVAGAGLMAGALLLMTPLLYGVWPLALLLIFLHSPGYMIHQVEEHTDDRFRTYINQRMFGGREALTTADVIWINAGEVWGLNLAALYIAASVGPGWALIAPYLMLVNALAHIGPAIRFRSYNPGLTTSFLIFLPLGILTLYSIPATLPQHALGFGLSVALHAKIAVDAVRKAGRAG